MTRFIFLLICVYFLPLHSFNLTTLTSDFIDNLEANDLSAAKEQISILERQYKISKDAENIMHQFVVLFIDEVNKRYSLSLTPTEVFKLLRRNIDSFQLSSIEKSQCLSVINGFQNRWNLLSLHIHPLAFFYKQSPDNSDLPAEVVIGGVQVFTGLLLCIIPATRPVGWVLLYSGIDRLLNATAEKSEQNKIDQQNVTHSDEAIDDQEFDDEPPPQRFTLKRLP